MSTEVRRVSESITCLRRASYLTCSYIVRTAQGLVLVDAGMDSDAADVHVGLRALNSRVEDIRAILLTHWHNDHAAGAQAIHAVTGAPVYYHRGDEPYFTGKAGATGLRRWLSDRVPELGVLVLLKGLLGESTPRAVAAARLVQDGDSLLGDFEVIATPGHTGSRIVFLSPRACALCRRRAGSHSRAHSVHGAPRHTRSRHRAPLAGKMPRTAAPDRLSGPP